MADASPKGKKKKPRSRYGDYCLMVDGEMFAVVNLPIGNGKYRQKRKRAANATEARQWALEQLDRVKHGTIEMTRATTFADLAAWYRREFLIAPVFENGIKLDGVRDYKKLRAKLDRIVEFFGGRQASGFTEYDLTAYARHRRKTDSVTTATINRDLALIRAMFNKGRDADPSLPVPKFPINMAAESERDRVLSFDEESRLLAVCVDREVITRKHYGRDLTTEIEAKRAHLAAIIIMAVDTAMRAGEIFKLDWRDVDLANDLITVQFFNSKTQKTRRIGMTPRVKAVLLEKAALDGKDGKVFGAKNASRAFRTACVRAEITDLHFHDLRHTATTRMIRAGIPHTEVMKITGHTQIKTFLRYLNLGDETVQNAASQLGRLIDDVQIIETDTVN